MSQIAVSAPDLTEELLVPLKSATSLSDDFETSDSETGDEVQRDSYVVESISAFNQTASIPTPIVSGFSSPTPVESRCLILSSSKEPLSGGSEVPSPETPVAGPIFNFIQPIHGRLEIGSDDGNQCDGVKGAGIGHSTYDGSGEVYTDLITNDESKIRSEFKYIFNGRRVQIGVTKYSVVDTSKMM